MRGKKLCRTLRRIRKQIADANGIPYEVVRCKEPGHCLGTCPKCEAEAKYIKDELERIEREGKEIVLDGIVSEAELRAAFASGPEEADEILNPPYDGPLGGIILPGDLI